MLEEHDLGGPDAADLRLNVLHTYARALLRLKDADTGLLRARGVLETLRRFYRADNVAMVLLQLEIASRGDPDAQFDWVDTLPSLQLTDSHNKAVMHHLHRLRKLDPERARRVLQRYLVERLAVNGNDQWIESALITLVWMPTSPEYRDETTTLEAAFTGLSQMWAKSLSAEAVHRVLVLLWKRIEEAFDREAYRAAEAWCRLAMHELLFDNMDDLKVGKVKRYGGQWADSRVHDLLTSSRKFLQCLLNQSNPEAAREAILTMAPAVIDGFSLLELEWVSKTLFNLALRFYKVWSSADTIQLLGHTAHVGARQRAPSILLTGVSCYCAYFQVLPLRTKTSLLLRDCRNAERPLCSLLPYCIRQKPELRIRFKLGYVYPRWPRQCPMALVRLLTFKCDLDQELQESSRLCLFL